jgi:energy-converting hydrogenase Eha subunit A
MDEAAIPGLRAAPRWPLRAARLLAAALVFHLVLIQPNHPLAMSWSALLMFPLELPVVLLALLALPPRARLTLWLRAALVAVLGLIALLKAADYAMFVALGRGFNPVADLPLVEAGLRLSTGAIGGALTVAAVLAGLVALAALGALLWWASGVWAAVALPRAAALGAGGAGLVCASVAVAEIGQAMGRWSLPLSPPGAAFTARVGVERVQGVRATLRDLRAFEIAAATDPFAGRADLLRAIDRDVLIVFVESYGRASHDTPLHAETHRATLARAEARLAARGVAMRSGFLEAPTRGGQSWLSHATFANGLWIDNQTSYRAALVSGRQTLFHIAAEAGFRTVAVMPQITLEWPEAAFMGFETVLAARDLGYEGRPFNWVTMPDQFTFAALDRLLRAPQDGRDGRPLFAQIALGSSHAPWVPVPRLVAWEDVGDGRIFNAMADAGDPPDVVWRDRDRVRAQYRAALDYALQVVFDYALRHAADPPLIFVVGDHQAAGFVAQDTRPDVPVHLLGPAELVAPAAEWGWRPGLLPDATAAPVSMARMRDRLLEAYTAPQGAGAGG